VRKYAFLILGCVALAGCEKEEVVKGSPAPAPKPPVSATPQASGSAAASATAPEPTFAELLAKSKPLAPKTGTFSAGPVKVSGELCTLSDGNPVGPSSGQLLPTVRVVGDRIVLIAGSEGAIKFYKMEKGPGCKLTLDTTVGTGGMIKSADGKPPHSLSSDDAGRLYASSIYGTVRYKKDLTVDYKCAPSPGGYIVAHQGGKWGYGHFVNATMSKVSFDTATCKGEASFLDPQKKAGPFSMINAVSLNGDTALIGGVLADGGKHVVAAFDKAGKEKFRIGNTSAAIVPEDGFGWVNGVSLCKLGICVLDSNFQGINTWSADGKKHLARISLKEVTGLTGHGWYNDLAVSKHGTFIAVTHERDVKKVNEGLVYRLTGL
jgi:hypothetical protein